MRNLLTLIILSLISNINLKLEEVKVDYVIEVKKSFDCHIWNNNTISLRTNITNPIAIFDTSDYESVIFDIGLKKYNKDIIVNMKCHIWKPKEDNYLALCDIEKEPQIEPFLSYEIDSIFSFKNKQIKFYSESTITSHCANVPLIYSDKQIIDLNDEKDIYYFKFKTGAVQDKNLIALASKPDESNFFPFDNCEVEERDMTCTLSKRKLESLLTYYEGNYKASLITIYFDNKYGLKYNPSAFSIEISKKEKQKEN